MIQRQQQRKEGQRQKTYACEKQRAGDDGANRALHPRVGANLIQVANRLHRCGGKDFAGGGTEYHRRNHGCGWPKSRLCGREENRHRTCSSSTWVACSTSVTGLAVREGPCATNPTPNVIRTAPSHRWYEIVS